MNGLGGWSAPLLAALLLAAPARAAEVDPPHFCQELAIHVGNGDRQGALDHIFGVLRFPDQAQARAAYANGLQDIVERLRGIGFDTVYEIDRLHEQTYGKSILQYDFYMTAHSGKVLIFRCRLARGRDGWFLQRITTTGDIDEYLSVWKAE